MFMNDAEEVADACDSGVKGETVCIQKSESLCIHVHMLQNTVYPANNRTHPYVCALVGG